MKVIKPSTPMRFEASQTSNLETECLFGEDLTILDDVANWYYCKLSTDNYLGWVLKDDLGIMNQSTHRVISNRTFLHKKDNIKSGYVSYLPLGAQVCVVDSNKGWAKVSFLDDSKIRYGYIFKNHLIKIGDKIDNWVGIAEKLIGTPYVWGGRNTLGLDCSALLQLSYQTYGKNIPRNSNDQSLLSKEEVKNIGALQRGFVVFWNGHVGIMADKINCIHANAHYMEVSKEPLDNIIKRSDKNNPILKIMNFN